MSAQAEAGLGTTSHGSREWFLQQQDKARKEMQTWPKWMRDGNVWAVAALPYVGPPGEPSRKEPG